MKGDYILEEKQRILKHPILDFKRGRKINFHFEGKRTGGYENESIAAALFASGVKVFRKSKRFGHPEGWFCGIGKCSSCLMRVNGIPSIRTCVTPVREEMQVELQGIKGILPDKPSIKVARKEEHVQVLIIGSGPAGLEAGITSRKLGLTTLIIDENPVPGGQLIKQTHKFFGSKEEYAGLRGFEIARIMLAELKKYEGAYLTETSAIGYYPEEKTGKHKFLAVQKQNDGYQLLEINADNIIITSGASENYLPFPKNYLPGVYGAGGVQTLMNVYGMKPGNKALIIGAGNVGLIVGYQLLQAGVEVKAVIEAMPHVGGYLVHASKLARLGVPILLRHTIKEVKGEEYVSSATIIEVDKNIQPIEGTERELDVDLILIAVGLSSSTKIPFQAGCEKMFVPELGGWVPIHNENMETSIEGIYVAGDVSGIAEASTAMLEGRIAGAAIAEKEAFNPEMARRVKEGALTELNKLRESSLLKAVAAGKRKCQQQWNEVKSHGK